MKGAREKNLNAKARVQARAQAPGVDPGWKADYERLARSDFDDWQRLANRHPDARREATAKILVEQAFEERTGPTLSDLLADLPEGEG